MFGKKKKENLNTKGRKESKEIGFEKKKKKNMLIRKRKLFRTAKEKKLIP